MHTPALKAGALFAALAVILGAFGAHGLANLLPAAQLRGYETGVTYQFYHSFALLITGILFSSFPFKSVRLAAAFFITGILLFCGSLYAMVFLSIRGISLGPVGIITPIGGLFFIIGWILLLSGIIKKNG
jgi:uncharacterized membrane protein YgdD (TMEM256/DUF423 family)